jgi:hypothetical protein
MGEKMLKESFKPGRMSTGYGRDKNTFKILVEYMKETHVCDLT